MSAGVAVWSGHQVTWALLGRASAFWLLEWSGILALTVATLAGLHTKWLVAAAAIALLITLTQ
ncbi:MAG: hypothetical protein HOV83_05745 [Catenulispora sp.]|nr:hypothetical protein [Catenulispora sp.]